MCVPEERMCVGVGDKGASVCSTCSMDIHISYVYEKNRNKTVILTQWLGCDAMVSIGK